MIDRTATPGRLPLKAWYGPQDVPGEAPGPPGTYPYRRGIHEDMYRGRVWTMRQYAGYGTASETNSRYHYLLDQGQTGLSVAFDLPTQLGFDSDHPLSAGEVGRVGVAISTLEDMAQLLHGIPLDRISLSMTINATAPMLLAMYVALARRQGINPDGLAGTVQNDVLKEYVARGNYVFPVGPSLKLAADVMEYCSKRMPRFNSISISGYHIREAGSTAVQELAFTFANAIAYIEAATGRGLAVDAIAPRVSFFFNSHRHFLEEVAKFRAARAVWAALMRDRFGAKDPRSCKLRFHTQTGGSTLTRQQPQNNIVRVTLQALAAVFGGTQSLHTNSYDEAVGLPTQESVTVALRTQQVIAAESGAADVADPLGGSYAIESLTRTVEDAVWDELRAVERMGGAASCIRSGYFEKAIEDSAYRWQREVESGSLHVVGVNTLAEEDEGVEPARLAVDPAIEVRRRDALRAHRSQLDSNMVGPLLDHLREIAADGDNVMDHLVECVDQGLTLGQLTECLRGVYGTQEAA
jgi:methylmalonyl-CoA mutase N-terminal domain/subunit